jgi:hypothetical protein
VSSEGPRLSVLSELSGRELAMLRAVAAGRGELLCGSEPDLAIDGYWCDFLSAHHLAHAGLVRPAALGRPGERVPAEITPTGRLALASAG